MKRLLALLCCAAVSGPAMAENWQLLALHDDSTVFYKSSSAGHAKGTARLWLLTDYREIGFINSKPYISSKHLAEFDCSGRRMRTLSGYSTTGRMGSGTVISSVEYSDADWSHVVPDSTGELALVVACGKK